MHLAIDTHVHIYPFYDVSASLHALLDNLGRPDAAAKRVGCLTERYDCNLFTELAAGTYADLQRDFDIGVEGESLLVRRRTQGDSCYLLPGQQVITRENIEILSLACCERVPEGRAAAETVRAILDRGGVPVAAWAPGKWFFSRGKVVRSLLETFSPNELALGDTTLRPIGWLSPMIYREARARGFRMLFGSDPLPYPGEEQRPGSYAASVSGNPGAGENPFGVVRSLLSGDWSIEPMGRRGGLPTVLRRLYRNNQAAKAVRRPKG